MRKLLFVLFLLVIPLAFAQSDDWLYTTESFVVNARISSEMNVVPSGSDYSLKNVLVNLSFFPKDNWQQQVLSRSSVPSGAYLEDYYVFQWEEGAFKQVFEVVLLWVLPGPYCFTGGNKQAH